MAFLPPLRRLLIEDFPSEKSWIGALLLVINNFNESVVNALNNSLTLTDNTTSDIVSTTLTSAPTSTKPVSIAWLKATAPTAVIVGNVTTLLNNKSANVTLTSAVQVQWQMASASVLQLTNVVGLPTTPSNATPYVLTLLCMAN